MKILPTIGPASDDLKSLRKIFNYCQIVRINASHNTIEWHKKTINKILSINPKISILLDIPGVKPRTDNKNIIKINKNDIVKFSYNKKKNFIKITKPLPKNKIKIKNFSLDDGKYNFKLLKYSKDELIGKSQQNCKILPRKGINIPGSVYDNNLQKKNYIKFLNFFKNTKVNLIGLSFVQDSNIIKYLKKKYPNLLFVSKIENIEGLKNSENICKNSDAVMIDRGDLSAEVGNEILFKSINKIAQSAKSSGKPLIMATENLESLSNDFSIKKNDIVSLGFSAQINSDIIMLSEETALSKNSYKIIKWLHNFIKNQNIIKKNTVKENIFWDTINLIKNHPIVIFTKKGLMFDKIFQKNINNNIFVFTDTHKTYSLAKFYKNAICIKTKKFNNSNIGRFYQENIKKNKNIIFKNSNNAFLITISFPKKGSVANTLTFINKKDF